MVYTFMNLGAFAVLTSLRRKGIAGDDIDDLAGLMRKSPGHALLMLLFLASLAGIPPTAGFLGKYYIFPFADRDRALRAGGGGNVVRGGGDLLLLPYCSQHVRERACGPGARRLEFRTACGARRDRTGDPGDWPLSRTVPAPGADFERARSVTYYAKHPHNPLLLSAILAAVLVCLFPFVAGYLVLMERKVLADFQVRLGPCASARTASCSPSPTPSSCCSRKT